MFAPEIHFHVRTATIADAAALALIGTTSFLDSYAGMIGEAAMVAHCAAHDSPDAFRRLLEPEIAAAWIAAAGPGGAPIGYTLVTPPDLPAVARSGDLELRRIYVLSRFHAAGLGRALMNRAIEHAHRLSAPRLLVGVYGGNDRAIAFYRRCGFTDTGTRRFTVGGETYDDLVLALDCEKRA